MARAALAVARKADKYAIRIDELLDPVELDIPCGPWPTKEDFSRVWYTLSEKDKQLVTYAIKPNCITVGDLYKLSLMDNLHESLETNSLFDRNILRSIIYAKMLRLESDVARRTYYETLLDLRRQPQIDYENLPAELKTDRDHIRELARNVDISAEGKRELHKQLIAYGMQTKIAEESVIQHGVTVREAIYQLADARAVLTSLIELSKLDGSYKEAGREETEDIENQADRIRRIKGEMQEQLDEKAAQQHGTAKKITDEDLGLDESVSN